jgi:hypothetical protein
LAAAVTSAEDGEIIQYLAGGPAILERFKVLEPEARALWQQSASVFAIVFRACGDLCNSAQVVTFHIITALPFQSMPHPMFRGQ